MEQATIKAPRFFLTAVGLLASAFLVMEAGQANQLRLDRTVLAGQRSAQEPQLGEATKLRHQAEAIAQGTAQLAQAGNVNAKEIIDYLRSQGIQVKSEASPLVGTERRSE